MLSLLSRKFSHKIFQKALFLVTTLSITTTAYCAETDTPKTELPKESETAKPTQTPLSEGASIVSKEGHFSVKLPNGFTTIDNDVQPIQTEMGEIETINYTSFTDTSACMAGASEYPEALLVFIKGKEKEVLDGAQEGALKNVNGTVVSSKDSTVEKLPAREVEFTAEADGQPLFGKALFILADSRLYHLLFISSSHSELDSSEVTKFFNSFKIID
ncbi:MAG: PsbP-related protein [Chlamydiales bacterium]|nr:PsbP-related protein [Chlamydiales bacterium]